MRPGATWTYASPSGTQTWTIESVSGDGAQATAVMAWSLAEVTGSYNWQCTPAGLVSYDFGALSATGLGQFATFEVASSSGVWLPAADLLTPGYAWTHAYEMSMQIAPAGGEAQTTGTSSVTTNSQVLGIAPVTVDGQSRDGLQILQNRDQVFQVTAGAFAAPATTMSSSSTLVFARGVGIVEMTGTDGTTTLVSFTVP
jgi:hypothetical protein